MRFKLYALLFTFFLLCCAENRPSNVINEAKDQSSFQNDNSVARKVQNNNEQKIVLDVDGWKIIGILNIPKSEKKVPIVILGHTLWGGEKSQYKDFVKTLSDNGIASLRIDLRGHGESINKGKIEQLDTNPGYLFDAWPDVVAAHKYVEDISSIDKDKIGVVASSYSGELVAKAGQNYKYAKAYVILSSALFSQESTLRIQYSNANWWHIVADDDPTFAKEAVTFVKKRSPSKVTFLKTGGHGVELLKSQKDLPQQIVNWLDKKLNNKDYILREKDLIPEGTAYNYETSTIYVGSIYRQKVITISSDGSIKDAITQESFKDLSPIGMEVDNKNNILWVNAALAPVVNITGKTEWKTTIMSFDLTTNQLIKRYEFIASEQAFLNDLTIAKNGNVYATESVNSKIYCLNKQTDELAVFLDLVNFSFPNGIVYHKPLNVLFVATSEGIVRINIESQEVKLVEVEDGINAKTIDGLAINDNYFIGHQSSKISKFYFNKDMDKITHADILDSGDDFDSSTTGEVGNGYYHYIVNSQIRSGINSENNGLKPLDSLEYVTIRRKML